MNFKNIYKNRFFLAAISGILFGISSNYVIIFPAVIALVPLIIATQNVNLKQAFAAGLLAGLPFAIISCNWMIFTIQSYTGMDTYTGIIFTIISAVILGIQLGMFCLIYVWLKNIIAASTYGIAVPLMIGSSVWVIIEWLRFVMLAGIPWLVFSFAHTQSRVNYSIQLSSITGPWGTAFIIAAVNMLIAFAVINRKIKYILIAAALFTANLIYGFILVQVNSPSESGRNFKAVLVCENFDAKTRWQEETGDSLASILINMSADAAKLNPDLIVWSETAVPWTFTTDDDLLNIALNKTSDTKATHLLGILTDAGKELVYNSVYSIRHDGKVLDRYDKSELLTLIEKPLFGGEIILPFFRDIGFTNILPGKSDKPIFTTVGKAGILICNESSVPFNATWASVNGADFLVNMSNDAWLENTVLVDWHFYAARMRAVENRKDIIVNSNRGISGIINSSGDILVKEQSKSHGILDGTINLNNNTTFYSRFGDWFVYFLIILLAAGGIIFKRKAVIDPAKILI